MGRKRKNTSLPVVKTNIKFASQIVFEFKAFTRRSNPEAPKWNVYKTTAEFALQRGWLLHAKLYYEEAIRSIEEYLITKGRSEPKVPAEQVPHEVLAELKKQWSDTRIKYEAESLTMYQ